MISPTPDILLWTSLEPGRHFMKLLRSVKRCVGVYSSESMITDQRLH